MSVALESGLAVTALHNHFFYNEPKVFFLHIGGEGNANILAAGVKRCLEKVKAIRAASAMPAAEFGAPTPHTNSISAKPLEEMFAVKAQSSSGMVKFVFGRNAEMHGVRLGKEIGVNTWAALAGTDHDAVVDGDFAVLEDELQPVSKSLRHAGINIVAIHNHMTHETPRVLFLHYWGHGKTAKLAKSVKEALKLCAGSPEKK